MIPAMLGKKIGMTQVFDEAGVLHPVTVVQADPCTVLQVKTDETDGYNAVQIGVGDIKPHRATRPQIGHAGRAGTSAKRFIREVRLTGAPADVEVGQSVSVNIFDDVTFVDVIGTSKGRGFAGVMKRHNFKGMGDSHGVKRMHRAGGSIASHGSDLGGGGNVKKGKRMPGHMGDARCTTRNHRLVGVDKENNLLLIKGALPGANGQMVFVRVSKTAKVSK
ncbi:MAG: 50S ribosomal protein L3 [Planctomycetota bacterium]